MVAGGGGDTFGGVEGRAGTLSARVCLFTRPGLTDKQTQRVEIGHWTLEIRGQFFVSTTIKVISLFCCCVSGVFTCL